MRNTFSHKLRDKKSFLVVTVKNDFQYAYAIFYENCFVIAVFAVSVLFHNQLLIFMNVLCWNNEYILGNISCI